MFSREGSKPSRGIGLGSGATSSSGARRACTHVNGGPAALATRYLQPAGPADPTNHQINTHTLFAGHTRPSHNQGLHQSLKDLKTRRMKDAWI